MATVPKIPKYRPGDTVGIRTARTVGEVTAIIVEEDSVRPRYQVEFMSGAAFRREWFLESVLCSLEDAEEYVKEQKTFEEWREGHTYTSKFLVGQKVTYKPKNLMGRVAQVIFDSRVSPTYLIHFPAIHDGVIALEKDLSAVEEEKDG